MAMWFAHFKDCQHTKCNIYTDGKRYKCPKCERQFSVRVGTIFEDSKISIAKVVRCNIPYHFA
jgi:transposase-like protein